MKKLRVLALLLSLCLLLTSTACQSEQDTLYSQALEEVESANSSEQGEASSPSSALQESTAPQAEGSLYNNYLEEEPSGEGLFPIEPEMELSGTLTISVDVAAGELELWAQAFEAAHPQVDIQINSGFDTYDAVSRAIEGGEELGSIQQSMVVELFSGEAGDIVELGTFPYQRYGESGLFLNLYELMEQDPEFHMEEYYSNIFKGWESADGKLFVLGPSVWPSSLVFNKLILDEMGLDLVQAYPQGMNYQDILQVFQEAKESGAMPENGVLGRYVGATSLNPFENCNYVDERSGTSQLDTPGYVEYLEAMKEVSSSISGYTATCEPFVDRQELVQVNSISMATLSELVGQEAGANKVYQTYRLENGGTLFRGSQLYGITSACKNPKLAWAFLKFLVSEKEFPQQLNRYGTYDRVYRDLYTGDLPICRKNLESLCHAFYGDMGEAVFQKANQVMESLTVQEFQDSALFVEFFDIYRDYFEYDLIDAQACAQQLQERAWIYFNE